MTVEQVPAGNGIDAGHYRAHTAWLRAKARAAARGAWLGLAILLAGLIVLAAPADLAAVQTVCTGRLCLHGQIHSSAIARLASYGFSVQTYGATIFVLRLACAVVSFAVALLIFRRKPHDRIALLGAATLLVWGTTTSGIVFVLGERSPAWMAMLRALQLLGSVLVTYFFFLFPTGTFVPRWMRWVAPAWIAGLLLPDLLVAVAGPSPRLGRLSSLAYDGWLASLVIAQLMHYRRATNSVQRRQTIWVLAGVVAGIGGYALVDLLRLASVASSIGIRPIPPFAGFLAYYGLMPLVPLSFGIAILRARLFDIDEIVNRALVYGGLTAGLVGLYVVMAGYLGTLFQAEGNLVISLVTTGLVTVLFQPLRERLQRAVNRMMYGDRDDPYAAISRLGQRLESVLAPEAVLSTIVQSVREALRLPYVAISLDEHDTIGPAAVSGTPVPDPLALPLVYQGEPLGMLLLGPRAPGEHWSRADRRLLGDLARQAGTALHALRLTLDLQHARARLVATREEERRRLRRDLHDGLGPVLGALAMQADTARDLVHSDPDEAAALLDQLTRRSQAALVEIRRVVHALRPPALDDLGLIEALRASAATMTHGSPAIVIEAPEPFPVLPAAIEVAVYRIVQEAVANVVRHAGARRCTVELWADQELHIAVSDDGRGIADDRPAGVGLHSMHERARELDGECRVERAAGGGTLVRARLPLVYAG